MRWVIEPVFRRHADRYLETGTFNASELCHACEEESARHLGEDPARVGDIPLGALRQRTLQPLLRLAEPFERGLCLRLCVRITAGGCAAHRIGGFTRLTRRFLQFGALLLAGEALQSPRGFFRLLGVSPLLGRTL